MALTTIHLGYAPDPVEYSSALDTQHRLHADVVADPTQAYLLLLEHPAVYTAGRRTGDAERPKDGTPVLDVDRGGLITWHGPGQLVAYPILPLADVTAIKDYVTRLEQAVIDTVGAYGVEGVRVPGRAGVWVLEPGRPDRKIAAIGIHVDHGVTYHGVALNIDNDLAPYKNIIPCGIADADVTTLANETGKSITVTDVAPVFEAALRETLAAAIKPEALLARPREEVSA
ncbi:MAG: lipoyl(octanoyl) transferase LipB [Galactobacter sp.]|uniref:lipoyl(octanoyl) transferase LipB n=1 Tax=Galactobacter sp. TaxID=2676125 RepID=UPI0025C2959A|nr:lipoyl(octanoyl) transferase LipB [Galactobacter sp.]